MISPIMAPDTSPYEADHLRFEQWFNDLQERVLERVLAACLEIEARLRRMAYSVSSNAEETKSSNSSNIVLGRGGLSKVEQMAAYVARHYTEQVQLRDIAKAVELNPDYASSLFQKAFGTTMKPHRGKPSRLGLDSCSAGAVYHQSVVSLRAPQAAGN
jgi:AraC-like DNA-binding protein